MSDELQVIATVQNEFEADMVRGVLAEAGIVAMQRLAASGVAGRLGGGGERDVMVGDADVERARDVLRENAAEE